MKTSVYFLCLVMGLTGCVYKTGALRKQISQYQGDGIITDASIAAPPFFSGPGFRLVFAGFDPGRPYEASYRLKGVPRTKYGESTIYVRFPGDWSPDVDAARKNITAVLSFRVLDETGVVLKSQDVAFSSAVWSWQGGGGDGIFGLWVPGEPLAARNQFYFDPAKQYQLRVSYVPGSVPPQTTNIYLRIENGGRI